MGNQQINYTVPVTEKKPGETPIYRNPSNSDALVNSFKGKTTIQDIFYENSQKFPNKQFLGTLSEDENNQKYYKYKTYSEVFDLAKQLGSGIINLNLIPDVVESDGRTMRLVGVFSKNREEWLLLEFANILYGNTMVPLYDTLGPESIPYVLNQTEIKTIFCSAPSIATILKCKDLGQLKNIVTMDVLKDDIIDAIKQRGLEVYKFQDLVESGKQNTLPFAQVKPHDILTFSYTSGTTGNPKGVMLSHLNFCAIFPAPETLGVMINQDDVYLSYLPLPHVFERILVLVMMAYGATVCFYGGDVMKIKDDLALVRPTIFASVPRLFHRLYQAIKGKLEQQTGITKKTLDYAMYSKQYYLQKGGHVTHRVWDKFVFNKTKDAFGGRVRYMVTGSAPISGQILDFLKVVTCAPVCEGYGQTESCGASFLTHPKDSTSGHVGGPLGNVEFKLVDVPELEYTSDDKDEQGRPCPRGEVCLRGPSIFEGYFKEIEKTKEVLDEDGWLHTGDIGLVQPENGALKIIDRKKNIFKLSQGEYVAPEKCENIYAKYEGVQEIFVYGDSLKSTTVAIAVPKESYILHFAKENNIDQSFEELCQNKQVVQHFLKQLQSIGKEGGLNGIENVKNLYLEPKSFVDHGCMTNTLKLQRHLATKIFKPVLDKLYDE